MAMVKLECYETTLRKIAENGGAEADIAKAALAYLLFGDNGVEAGCGLWQDADMDREQVIARLRKHQPELKAAGVEHLFLHGSYARGTAVRGLSDVDVIAEFDPGRRLSLLDMIAIENLL